MRRYSVRRSAGMLMYLAVAAAAAVVAATAATPTANTQVFCTDLGIDFEFMDSSSNNHIPTAEPSSGLATSCLRHVMMNAVGNYVAAQMDAFAVSAVDCVRESVPNAFSASAASSQFFAVLSVCSRSNVQLQTADARVWDAGVRAEIDETFGASSVRDGIRAANGAVWTPRRVTLSPSYTLPDGKGMPRFEFRGATITADDKIADASASGVSVTVAVRNTGKVPLHLFRVTLIETIGGDTDDKLPMQALLALLPTPVVVEPGKSARVIFRSAASQNAVAVAASKSYAMYVSHSGFRGHRFVGALQRDGMFASPSATVEPSSNERLDAVLSPTTRLDPMLASFPLGSWRVLSIAIVAIVGLAATLYTRRSWSSVSLRRSVEWLRRAIKPAPASQSAKTTPRTRKVQELTASSAWKSKRSDVDALHDVVSDREMDELESEGLMASDDTLARKSKLRQSATRDTKMPAIQMQWTPPAAMPESFCRPLELDGSARLDPKRFENLWDEYLQRFQSSDVLAGRVDADALIAAMQALGVTCMASGTVDGVDKFVFYAQPRMCDWFFFLVLDITLATHSMGLTLRTSSDARDAVVDDFVRVVTAAIQQAVIVQQM